MFRVAVSVSGESSWNQRLHPLHVVNYFTVYLTIDKLPRVAIIPLQYWTVTDGTKLHSNSSSPNKQSTPGQKVQTSR